MASALNTKINSYNLERGIEFSEEYVLPPTRTGSNELGPFLSTATAPVYESTVGPAGGAGSWKFTASATGGARVVSNDSTELAGLDDEDWTQGFWFKISSLPTLSASGPSTAGINLGGFTLFPNNAGWSAYVVPTNSTATSSAESGSVALAGRIIFNFTSTISVFTPVIVPDNWYYIVARRVGTQMAAYLNGQLIGTETNTNLDGTPARVGVGSATHSNNNSPQYWISNYHQSTASAVDETAIAEIWATGSTQNKNILANPFEANASEIQPTTITTTADSINILTSIEVNANSVDPLITIDTDNFCTAITADALMVDPVLTAETNALIQETPAIASSESLDASITADKEFIFNAAPAESNFELLLPSWSPPPQAPLYYLPGTLREKIATYPIEYGVEFDTKTGSPFTGVPVYGSRATGATSDLTSTGSSFTVAYSVDGPPASDSDSYLLNAIGALRPYSTATATALRPIWQDLNYTIGFWFKIDSLPTGNLRNGLTLARIRPTSGANGDFEFMVTGSSYPGNPSKLAYTFNNTGTTPTLYFVGPTLNTTDWNYLTIRRTSANIINNFEVYLNGQLVDTKTNSDTGIYPEFEFGANVATQTGNYKIQNLHMATSTALTPYEIGQIWLAGTIQEPATPVNAIYPPEPISLDATIVDGTYIATRPDSVNIATSFPVDALMVLPAWSNATESRYTADVIELDATLPQGIGVDTFADKIIPAESLTAAIDIVDPLLSRFAFTASALLVEPVVSVAPNYLALVQNLNPVFYIQDGQSVPQQLGSWPVTGWEVEFMSTNITSGEEMTSVGNGKSWQAVNPFNSATPKVQALVPDYMQRRADLYATRSASIEIWYYSLAGGTNAGTRVESGPIFDDGTTRIAEVFDWWGSDTTGDPSNTHVLIADLIKNYDFTGGIEDASASWRTYYGQPKRDSWNHVVVTYEPLTNPNQVRQKVYLNGSIISNLALNIIYDASQRTEQNIVFPTANDAVISYGPQIGWRVVLSGSQTINQLAGVRTDEFAIYDRTLSENQVYSHYTFMKNLSPDTDYSPIVYGVSATSGDHQVLPVQNALYQETPFSGLAGLIPEPEIIGGKSRILFTEEFESMEAELLEPVIRLDITVSAEIIPVYAELNNHFVSNNTYYQYVKTNINPYRYVNFDSSDSLFDHGIDNSYSVVPTSVGGAVVSYDLGINNKSAKTAGSNYATDGVILKESEWNDSWGTGANDWHSAFWFQRAADDQSINGLRVLWNLNGYKDNQHAVLYQYQGKLHMQVNNGSGTFIETDSTALDLFDYNRHFIVIDHNHGGGGSNTVKVYVDSVLRFTANVGSITPTTTNAATADSGPNLEINNRPRLGVGCLITPFASTALPAVPTNTKLIVDEIHWDKNTITATAVTNLYNAMPAKTNTVNLSDPLTASCELIMPNVSGDSVFVTTPATCDIEIVDPAIFANFVVQFTAQPMTANATITDAERSDSVNIVTEFMLASAALGSFGTPRLIFADTMEASFALQDRPVTGTVTIEGNGIRVNGIRTFAPITIWADYVTSSAFSEYIIPMKEVV
jgi:hypothetical protein